MNNQDPVTKELFNFAIKGIHDSINEVKERIDGIHEIDTKTVTNSASIREHEARLRKLEGGLAKLAWTVVTAIVAGIMNFILSGGLKK